MRTSYAHQPGFSINRLNGSLSGHSQHALNVHGRPFVKTANNDYKEQHHLSFGRRQCGIDNFVATNDKIDVSVQWIGHLRTLVTNVSAAHTPEYELQISAHHT
jgi:hypothetical protein